MLNDAPPLNGSVTVTGFVASPAYKSAMPGARMSRDCVARNSRSVIGRQTRPAFQVSTVPLWE